MNNSEKTRRQLIIRFVQDFRAGVLEETIDRIPVEMRPLGFEANRCCIYKDRAMLRYRLLALMGFGMEEDIDDVVPLKFYLCEVLNGVEKNNNVLTVCTVGCAGCVNSHVHATDSCVGCFARPCVAICPYQAISVINQRATIDRTKCVNCEKCISVCPYKAIVRNPLPCEDVCPVKAISKREDGRVRIDFSSCIACGKCYRACPFSAIMDRSDLLPILMAMQSEKKVIALVAPSITHQFPGDIEQLFVALKLAGFAEVVEVALGAELTIKHEAEEFFERMERGDRLMASSCCPAWVETAKKHFPEMLPLVSSTPSPMAFAGRLAAEKFPDAVKVFIGPCIAKRREAQNDPQVDLVMTFEELWGLLAACDIKIPSLEAAPLEQPATNDARDFSKSCGVSKAILNEIGDDADNKNAARPKMEEKFINGIDRKAISLLKIYAQGKLPEKQAGNFLEVMVCQGGCISGPGSLAR